MVQITLTGHSRQLLPARRAKPDTGFVLGAAGAADSALSGNLAVLRSAIDLYAAEHGGAYPTLAKIEEQLTLYSNYTGADTQAARDATHPYGPYLRSVPPLPVGADKGKTSFVANYTAGNRKHLANR